MKKRKPVKHAHRKTMIRQRLARGKYSRLQIRKYCGRTNCFYCQFYNKERCCFGIY